MTPATIASHHGALHVGVDIGGTFTDTIAIDESGSVSMSTLRRLARYSCRISAAPDTFKRTSASATTASRSSDEMP